MPSGGHIDVVVNGLDTESGRLEPKRHRVRANKFTTVLDALIRIKESQDPSLAVRYSCRMGVCGSCAVVINGKPSLACQTNAVDCGDKVVVEPMQGLPVLKGLVTDFDEFFEKHKAAMPWIVSSRGRAQDDAHESGQTAEERDAYLPFAECIKCGLCLDACPVVNTNPDFIGPQALAQAYRYNADSRDSGTKERIRALDSTDGVWGCEYSGSCSKVCPKSVDPAFAIQLLKASIIGKGAEGLLHMR